jgi:hypothetical protein
MTQLVCRKPVALHANLPSHLQFVPESSFQSRWFDPTNKSASDKSVVVGDRICVQKSSHWQTANGILLSIGSKRQLN